MISSTSSSDPVKRPDLPVESHGPSPRPFSARPDRISTNAVVQLRTALANDPETRSAVIERARVLAADPSYPSMRIMQAIARKIIAAPDLSGDES
jgi:hypothetical protein